MLLRRSLLVLAALAFSVPSYAAIGDPCTEDEFDANGNLTADNYTEVCEGAQATFCAPPQGGGAAVEQGINCASLFADAPVGTCEEYAGFGPRCAFNDGDACVFAAGAENPFIPMACVNDTSGCLDGTCQPDVGACAFDPNAGLTCLAGGQASFCAPWLQQVGLLCPGWAAIDGINDGGGTLTCTGAGVCTGVGEGGQCATGLYECAEGACNGESPQALGTCGAPVAEGEGEGEPEGECEANSDCGDGEVCVGGECVAEQDPPLCSDVGGARGAAPFGALALLTVLVPVLRRRRR